jgi:hypothetical protein
MVQMEQDACEPLFTHSMLSLKPQMLTTAPVSSFAITLDSDCIVLKRSENAWRAHSLTPDAIAENDKMQRQIAGACSSLTAVALKDNTRGTKDDRCEV